MQVKKNRIKRHSASTIILLVLLALRGVMQFIIPFVSPRIDVATIIFFAFFGILYIVAFIGIVHQKKWGSTIAMVVALLDLVSALLQGGVQAVGAGVYDIVLIGLAYRNYSTVKLIKRT